jgi:2-iminobutanoate/2-iminopropanoate deaminase
METRFQPSVFTIEGETLEGEDRQRCGAGLAQNARRIVRSASAFACALVFAGCTTGGGTPMLGSRPLIYKQGPGDEAAQRQAAAERAAQAAPPSAPAASSPAATGAQATPSAAPSSAGAPAPSTTPSTSTASTAPAAPASAATPAPQPSSTASVAAQVQSAAIHTLPPALTRYTQATRYGDLLFLSGQIGIDPRTGGFAPDAPVEQQTRQALENVRTILEVNGLTMANIVAVTLYVANMNALGAIDGVYASFFKSVLPARSVVEVQRLPRGAQVEVTVVAGR